MTTSTENLRVGNVPPSVVALNGAADYAVRRIVDSIGQFLLYPPLTPDERRSPECVKNFVARTYTFRNLPTLLNQLSNDERAQYQYLLELAVDKLMHLQTTATPCGAKFFGFITAFEGTPDLRKSSIVQSTCFETFETHFKTVYIRQGSAE